MSALYSSLRRLLFRLDAERAHRIALALVEQAERLIEIAPAVERRLATRGSHGLEQKLWGRSFPNPIGLAAGFDKDGVAPHVWGCLGFGFAEIGTVTALAQPGNPRPRMFRLEAERAIVNRLGFNSSGASNVAERLAHSLRRRPAIPLGINIGCSRAAMGDPTAELSDLRAAARQLAPRADYLAINVSSPNTPGLRELQAPGRLQRIVAGVVEELRGISGVEPPPIVVKLAPDLADQAVEEICHAAIGAGARGFIAGNTTLARPDCASPQGAEPGGLSGLPLRRRATELVALVRSAVGPRIPVIGVGGVFTVDDVFDKLGAGADLVALYTGLVYEGPFLPGRLARALARELKRRGVPSIAQLSGSCAAP